MLSSKSERCDSGQPHTTTQGISTTFATTKKQNVTSKPKANHKRKSSAKPRLTFKSQPSSSQAGQKPHPSARRPSQLLTNTTPNTKHHKAFASLFVSLLATSPVAIEEDAVDEKTVKSANAASTTPQPPKPELTGAVWAAEIRRARWKRFRYETGLKFGGGAKMKLRRENIDVDDMEMADMRARKRGEDRQQGVRTGIA